jgi:hypothetical protein
MGLFDQGPDYTVKDLVYYTGLFAGIIVVYLLLAPFGLHPLLKLVPAIFVGAGLGWACEQLYTRSRRPPRDPHRDDDWPQA